ncbi:radical SAM protein [bacterium]|nr:radical SAM protein [candidate division CSSED10-310 bacterium]
MPVKQRQTWQGDDRTEENLSADGGPLLKPCLLEGINFQFDPYFGCGHQCVYCYALCRSGGEWNRRVYRYENMVDRLRQELMTLDPQRIYMGWNTDPYQPAERKEKATHQSLHVLAKAGFTVTLLTKSDLILRDLQILKSMHEVSAGISLAFPNESVRNDFEPAAPSNTRRIEALRKLRSSGISTYALICPVIPLLTDITSLIRDLSDSAATIWVYPLSVNRRSDRNWKNICGILKTNYLESENQIHDIALDPDHEYWSEQREMLIGLAKKTGLEIHVEF